MDGDDLSRVESSGLFDHDWYLASYPQAVGTAREALAHFCRHWREGFQPNACFDPVWYARTYGTELRSGENPLAHYIRRGERENAWPSPHFDPEWYRDEYGVGAAGSPLRHYLLNRAEGTYKPLPAFDPEPETPPAAGVTWAAVVDLVGGNAAAGIIPDTVNTVDLMQALRLFIPLLPFDETWYCDHYPDIAAALSNGELTSAHAHFIEHGFFEGRSPAPP